MLTRIHDALIDPENVLLSYKTFSLHIFSGGSLAVMTQSATEVFQLIGAMCLAFSAFMTVVINWNRYKKGIKSISKGCPDDEIQEKE